MQTVYDYSTKQFGLFQGKRTEAEDMAILESIEEACLDEVMHFVDSELDEDHKERISNVLNKYSEDENGSLSLLDDVLEYCDDNIPDCALKLSERMDKLFERVAQHAA